MKFICSNLRLVEKRSFKSKAGNDLVFVKLADTITYENVEFMLSRDQHLDDVEIGKNYNVSLICDGKFTNVYLSSQVK